MTALISAPLDSLDYMEGSMRFGNSPGFRHSWLTLHTQILDPAACYYETDDWNTAQYFPIVRIPALLLIKDLAKEPPSMVDKLGDPDIHPGKVFLKAQSVEDFASAFYLPQLSGAHWDEAIEQADQLSSAGQKWGL